MLVNCFGRIVSFTNVMNFSLTIQNVPSHREGRNKPSAPANIQDQPNTRVLRGNEPKTNSRANSINVGDPHKIKSLTYRIKAKLRIINKSISSKREKKQDIIETKLYCTLVCCIRAPANQESGPLVLLMSNFSYSNKA